MYIYCLTHFYINHQVKISSKTSAKTYIYLVDNYIRMWTEDKTVLAIYQENKLTKKTNKLLHVISYLILGYPKHF